MQFRDPQLFQNCVIFDVHNINWNQIKISWCIIKNDHYFERTEDRATVFWNWTDFSIQLKSLHFILIEKKNVSFSYKISCILFAHRIPVTNFEAMNLKSQMFCFYILSFLIFKLMFISGRNFAYDRALRVIEDEEYLDDIDFVRAHHIFSQILNLRIFFTFF